MPPKLDITEISLRQSPLFDSWCKTREHKSLIRSFGHRFRDGRWEGDEDTSDFHVYRELEAPSFAASRTLLASPNYVVPGSSDPFGYELQPYQWKPALTRSAYSVPFQGENYDVDKELPLIEDPPTGDFILGLNAQGTNFIRRARPGNPVVHIGQYLIELRQLPTLPHFLLQRAKRFKDLGSEYLNVEFGWRPFISDLLKIHDFTKKVSRRISWLIAHNGNSIRRRDDKKVTTHSSLICEGSLDVPFGDLSDPSIGGNPLMDGYHFCGPFGGVVTYPGFGGQTDYRLSTSLIETEWNVGTFSYYVPNIGSNEWSERAVRCLYDANVTPAVIYSVIPWTWLIDWFANVGDIVSNANTNAVDNETLTNCFAMYLKEEYTVVEVSSHWDQVDATSIPGSSFFLPAGDASVSHTVYRSSKLRHQASPFGFGLKRAEFTARQLAILAALLTARSGAIKDLASWLGHAKKR